MTEKSSWNAFRANEAPVKAVVVLVVQVVHEAVLAVQVVLAAVVVLVVQVVAAVLAVQVVLVAVVVLVVSRMEQLPSSAW